MYTDFCLSSDRQFSCENLPAYSHGWERLRASGRVVEARVFIIKSFYLAFKSCYLSSTVEFKEENV